MQRVSTVLSHDQTEQVLVKLGLSARPSADLDGLASVYHAWCRRVPFDNVRKLIHVNANDPGVLPGDQPSEFFDAWLKYGSGGTCWSGNGALCTLLASLGFDAYRGVATMMVAPDVPPNHGTVQVRFGESVYAVDASILHSEPLLLHGDQEAIIKNPAWGVRAHRREGKWIITWKTMVKPEGFDCRIEHMPASAQEFSERHENTRLWSPFNYEVSFRLIKGTSAIGLWGGKRFEFTASGEMAVRDMNDEQRREFLIKEAGLGEQLVTRLPPDRPTPPPPWSETARAAGT